LWTKFLPFLGSSRDQPIHFLRDVIEREIALRMDPITPEAIVVVLRVFILGWALWVIRKVGAKEDR
jgi:hypothetical protein